VLLVEGREAREAIGELLELLGYEVATAARASDALRTGSAADVVVTGEELPDGTGAQLLAGLRARRGWRGVPVILLSGAETCPDGANGFAARLTKPLSIYDLDRALQRAVESS
jgi:CheY-like chemotaxis protein